MIVDLMMKTGTQVRWTPHQRMPVDVLTKSDITKGNGALLHLLRHASLRIDKEENELIRRKVNSEARSRSRPSSEKLLKEEEELDCYLEILGPLVWATENYGS